MEGGVLLKLLIILRKDLKITFNLSIFKNAASLDTTLC